MSNGNMETATFKGEQGIHAVSLASYPAPATVCGRSRDSGDGLWDMHGEENWAWTVTCPECIQALGRTQPLKDVQDRLEELIGSDRLALIARMRAALKFLSPDDITPMGKRMLEKILDEEERR